jgi:RHS repeat-associated protein
MQILAVSHYSPHETSNIAHDLQDHAANTVLECCEYDAYGNPTILDASHEPRATSHYKNPYLFTGRRVDILDNGSLKIQYNRNRYYDYYSGRWLTHDPLQYRGGLNLYGYTASRPTGFLDPFGLLENARIRLPWLDGSSELEILSDECDCRFKLYVDGTLKWDLPPGSWYPFDYKWLKRPSSVAPVMGTVTLETDCERFTRAYNAQWIHYKAKDFDVSYGLGENFGLHFVDSVAQGTYSKYTSTGGAGKLDWDYGAAVWETGIKVMSKFHYNTEAGFGAGMLLLESSPFGTASDFDPYTHIVVPPPPMIGPAPAPGLWPAPPPGFEYGTTATLHHSSPLDKWFVLGNSGSLAVRSTLAVFPGGGMALGWGVSASFALPGGPRTPDPVPVWWWPPVPDPVDVGPF